MEETTGFTLKQLAEEDRPREKLQLKGRQNLTNAELLAILIGSGNTKETAVELTQRILLHFNNDLNVLGKQGVEDLSIFKGIGPAKALTIIAALELGRRRNLATAEQKVQMKSSRDIFEIMYPLIADLPNEEFWVLHLNKANRVVDKEKISIGGIAGTVVDIKIILKSALLKLASSLVLIHNHPSGNLQPSEADIAITKKLKTAAQLLEIMVLDHVIIGDKDYYSFADSGII